MSTYVYSWAGYINLMFISKFNLWQDNWKENYDTCYVCNWTVRKNVRKNNHDCR